MMRSDLKLCPFCRLHLMVLGTGAVQLMLNIVSPQQPVGQGVKFARAVQQFIPASSVLYRHRSDLYGPANYSKRLSDVARQFVVVLRHLASASDCLIGGICRGGVNEVAA